MGDRKACEVYEGGEESKLASKTGTGGYEDRTTAMEKYEAIQSRDDYEEGDAAGEDEEVVRSGEYAEEEVREEEKNKVCSKEERISSPLKEGSQTGTDTKRETTQLGDMMRSTTRYTEQDGSQAGKNMTGLTTQLGDITRPTTQLGEDESNDQSGEEETSSCPPMPHTEKDGSQTVTIMTRLTTQLGDLTRSNTQLGDKTRLMEQT